MGVKAGEMGGCGGRGGGAELKPLQDGVSLEVRLVSLICNTREGLSACHAWRCMAVLTDSSVRGWSTPGQTLGTN